MYSNNVIEMYNIIKEQFLDMYQRKVKDNIWKRIKIDQFCTDKYKYKRTIQKMQLLEVWSFRDTDPEKITYSFINKKIENTIEDNLRHLLFEYMMYNNIKPSYLMDPNEYVDAIINTIKNIKIKRGSIEERLKFCDFYRSNFHHPKNCPNKYRLKPSTTKPQINWTRVRKIV
ncbi:uncharacterized protein PWA37_001162 [Arxiozyma heterogenica]|uniref:uncharacterized protein n=1 Tax=Arxiozyma heterogenica TaxID=278026 RepID=UPI002F1805C6